jgi:neutral trehalase
MASFELPERWFADGSGWYDHIKERAAEYAGAAEALDLFAGLRDGDVDDEVVEAVAARIIMLVEGLPATNELVGEWQDDPAVWPVLRAIASSFTPAQQRAVAVVLAHFAKGS